MMNKATVFGVFTALLALVWLMYVMGAGSGVAVIELPFEAFQGLVFFFGWGLDFPMVLGYVVSGVCVLAVLLLGFVAGYKLWRWVSYNK